ncbi:hypothetical protein CHELA40_14703 [Chelatococcus asaccharovorans]|nr:hypothetical protein CHELA40_14703 [Chelatococcus asaccharovorans]
MINRSTKTKLPDFLPHRRRYSSRLWNTYTSDGDGEGVDRRLCHHLRRHRQQKANVQRFTQDLFIEAAEGPSRAKQTVVAKIYGIRRVMASDRCEYYVRSRTSRLDGRLSLPVEIISTQ